MAKRKYKKRTARSKGRLPNNFIFWRCTCKNTDHMEQFLDRGSEKQDQYIIETLSYLKVMEPEYFDEIEGSFWLRKFKEKQNARPR